MVTISMNRFQISTVNNEQRRLRSLSLRHWWLYGFCKRKHDLSHALLYYFTKTAVQKGKMPFQKHLYKNVNDYSTYWPESMSFSQPCNILSQLTDFLVPETCQMRINVETAYRGRFRFLKVTRRTSRRCQTQWKAWAMHCTHGFNYFVQRVAYYMYTFMVSIIV